VLSVRKRRIRLKQVQLLERNSNRFEEFICYSREFPPVPRNKEENVPMTNPNEFQPPPPPAAPSEPVRPRPTYLMWAGIALFIVGLIVAVLGIPMLVGLITGGLGTGAAICALGALFVGFSFIRLPATGDAPPPPSSEQKIREVSAAAIGGGAAGWLFTRLFRSLDLRIFFEPTAVFRSLRAHPNWVAPLLLVGIINGAYTTAFVRRLTPERIINFTVDKLQDSPIKPPPEALEKMRTEGVETQKAITQQIGNFLKAIVSAYFGAAFLAALCLLAVLAFGGRMHYWQTLSVIAYVIFPVTLIQKGISFLILYLKSPDDIHPLLGQESLVQDNLVIVARLLNLENLVSAKDHPVIFVVVTYFGVLALYRLWLTGVGLREGGYKVSSSQAWGVAITLFVIGLLLVMGVTAIFPSFVG
jgi:hypothetical protein